MTSIESITASLHTDDTRWPDRHGAYHADCPYCGKPAKKGQTHFSISADGLCYCQVCQAGTTISALAAHLGIETRTNGAQPQTIYDYRDATGTLAYQVVRYYKAGEKKFFQRRPDGNSGWINNLGGVDRVLYRLPDVLAAVAAGQPVYIVEGEKDVEMLRRRGIVATTNVGGAGKWQAGYSAAMRGADVIILPDNDVPGEQHARQVREALQGAVKSVKIVRLPGLGEKGDVSDWLAMGHTTQELQALIDSTSKQAEVKTEYATTPSMPTDVNDLLRMERKPVVWYAPSFLREGLGLLVGQPNVGKTPIAIQLGIAVATGGKWLNTVQCKQARVLYLGMEYSPQELIPMFDISRMGQAIPRECLLVKTIEDDFPTSPDAALEELEWYLRVMEVRVIIIDVLTAFLPPEKFKQNIYRGDYSELKPYHRLALQYNAAILGVWHASKRESDPKIMYNGSAGMWAAAASRITMYQDTEQRTRIAAFPRMGDRIDWALTQEKNTTGRRWVLADANPEPVCSPTEMTIYRCLKAHADKSRPFVAQTITDMTGVDVRTVRTLLPRMYEKNLIQKSRAGDGYFIEDVALVADVAGVADVVPVADVASLNGATRVADALLTSDALGAAETGEQQEQRSDPITTTNGQSAWSRVPATKQTFLRLYMRSNKDSDQDQARELCAEYGVDIEALRKEMP